VQLGFQANRVLAEDQGVDVEPERNRGPAQFVDPLQGLKAPRHADLDDSVTEGPDIGDHVYVASADVGRSGLYIVQCAFDLCQLRFHLTDGGVVTPLA
jgi:hypothetical protein